MTGLFVDDGGLEDVLSSLESFWTVKSAVADVTEVSQSTLMPSHSGAPTFVGACSSCTQDE